MKKILLITPLYPIPFPENNATDVCHSFAKEWVSLGYDVRVIHLQPVHCLAWHQLVRFFGDRIANIVGGGNFYAKRLMRTQHYSMDGVDVHRVPVFNFIPHGRYPGSSIRHFVDDVHSILDEEQFRPDAITGHMVPLELIPLINERYGARTCNVEHGIPKKIKERYPDYRELISRYDTFGFRSAPLAERYQREICPVPNPFVCLSGIPDTFVQPNSVVKTGRSFLYVGELIERKYPAALISALSQAFPDKDFSLTYIGDGPEREKLERMTEEYKLSEQVTFLGKLPREALVGYYDSSLCLIMVSRGEAFGLVYVEAMARGCLVVASRGEGMDGVIVDGENGFLCTAGDTEELAQVIKRMASLPAGELKRISENAIQTARLMTDRSVAQSYADILLK